MFPAVKNLSAGMKEKITESGGKRMKNNIRWYNGSRLEEIEFTANNLLSTIQTAARSIPLSDKAELFFCQEDDNVISIWIMLSGREDIKLGESAVVRVYEFYIGTDSIEEIKNAALELKKFLQKSLKKDLLITSNFRLNIE